MGRDPKFRELWLVSSLSWKDCIWMSEMGGVGGDGSSWPITKSGRVRKNRTALNVPEREKRVAVKRVN